MIQITHLVMAHIFQQFMEFLQVHFHIGGRLQREDPNYHPLLNAISQCKRIFSNEEEGYLTDYIEENIIKQGSLFQNQDFIYLKYYYEKDYSKLPKFNTSDRFVTDFKRRNGFITRRLHCS